MCGRNPPSIASTCPGRIDKKLNGNTCRDSFEERAAFLVKSERAVRAQADVHDIDEGIASSIPSSGRGCFAHEVTAARADQELIVDAQEFPRKRHEPVRSLRKLDTHLSHLIDQAQFIPPVR